MAGLAVFDLDNTLLAGDSDYLWGEFLVHQGLVDGPSYEAANKRFYAEYLAGTLDIIAFAEFSLAPLARIAPDELEALRQQFVRDCIEPRVARGTPALLERHRAAGDTLLITTATNRFITAPIASLLGVPHLIATEPEHDGQRYTGHLTGIPNFREGKVTRLRMWRDENPGPYTHITGYSDSHNDLPLLGEATQAYAVDPDARLRAEAERRGWPILSLR